MLWKFQQLRGRFPNKMIRQHLRFCESLGLPAHYDSDLKFLRHVLDPVSKAPTVKVIDITSATEDLSSKLLSKRSADDDKKAVLQLKDLLDRMLVLDPSKRISVKEAIAHPFIRSKSH
jgi:serine/threonine-protein kinase PRP4